MGKHKELVASFEHMGNDVWFVDTAWALGDEATEVVRCRDCKYCVKKGHRIYCDLNVGGFPQVEPNGFCYWGERNE